MAAPPAQAAGACDREGGDDDDPIINQDGCGRFYGLLEECMGEHNRDWRKCQAQLQAWRVCSERAKQQRQPPPQPPPQPPQPPQPPPQQQQPAR
jgi:hypothetical protein